MAHKHQTKGANRRRTEAKKRTVVLQRKEQQKFTSTLSNLEKAAQSLVDSNAILLLAPKIFQVKALVKEGLVDLKKLRTQDMIVHGNQIVANYEDLANRSKALRTEVGEFVEGARKVQVNQTQPEKLFDLAQHMLALHAACEQWLLDFNAGIHAPLMEAMVILNEALTGDKVNLEDAVELTRALKVLSQAEEVTHEPK